MLEWFERNIEANIIHETKRQPYHTRYLQLNWVLNKLGGLPTSLEQELNREKYVRYVSGLVGFFLVLYSVVALKNINHITELTSLIFIAAFATFLILTTVASYQVDRKLRCQIINPET